MAKEMAILAFLILFLASAIVQRTAAATPALYVFGDSTSDVGNYFPQYSPVFKNPPYGIDYPGGTPTGRPSNGLLTVDYTAEAIGLPKSPPAFRTITDELQTVRGVNFASSSSGILNTTGVGVIGVITFDEQIEDFKEIVANLTAQVGASVASLKLSHSIFYVSAGSNDLFEQFAARRPGSDIQKDQIVALLVNIFREQFKTLYKLGARKFAVSSTGLVGCTPLARLLYSASLDCVDDLNDLSLRFKIAVSIMLENLSATQDGFKYSYVDFYGFGMQVLSNPSKYGFTETKSACCGGGSLNTEVVCGSANATYCSDRTKYFFWDFVHPTQAVYKQSARLALTGTWPLVTPMNFLSLIIEI